MKLILAPIRGVTDYVFRDVFVKYFGGIDYAVSPFIVTSNCEIPKQSLVKDILPENNRNMIVIPQLLGKDAREFIVFAKYIRELGYKEINWNLGCPHKIVARRGRGSGLIPFPEKINEFLQQVFDASMEIDISIKIRLGRNSQDEILNLVDIFNSYPIKNLTIHPRTGIQMYDGEADVNAFSNIYRQFKTEMIYNGDITDYKKFSENKELLPGIENWMLGRGLLSDLYLSERIKSDNLAKAKVDVVWEFHNELFKRNCERLYGGVQILGKMKELWGYLIEMFENPHKELKKIVKTKDVNSYLKVVDELFRKH